MHNNINIKQLTNGFVYEDTFYKDIDGVFKQIKETQSIDSAFNEKKSELVGKHIIKLLESN